MKQALKFVTITSILTIGTAAVLVAFFPPVKQLAKQKIQVFKEDFTERENLLAQALAPSEDAISEAKTRRQH